MSTRTNIPGASPAAIDWLEWGDEAFARAARERKPVLLSIGATWCHGCLVMDRTTYADPAIVALVGRRTVAVRVDADRRPDVNERYNLEGWPTTALLTPSGEILTGGTYVTPDVMPRMVAEAADALESRYDDLMARAGEVARARRAAAPAHRYEPDLGAADWFGGHLAGAHDPQGGGFGAAGKFLHAPALRFALERAAAGDARLAAVVTHTLDAMLRGAIVDDVDGGFFRYAGERDWSRPHTEKMLEDQAAMAALLVDAAAVFGRADYRARGLDTVAYVRRSLSDAVRGGFYASQRADEEFYGLSGSIRATLDPPPVDRTLFTDANAQAAIAWLRIGEALGDTGLGRFALQSLERVLLATYRPGAGVAHWADPGATRGLLTDQVWAAWALLHLHEATGSETYPMLAEELMRTAMRTMWDEAAGGFRDRAPAAGDVGMLSDPVKPLALNCLAARVLVRLARLTGEPDLDRVAAAALGSQTGLYRSHGPAGAPYALAVLDVLEPAPPADPAP
jgi:uncharacterized protein YyaL (SSP411 family)